MPNNTPRDSPDGDGVPGTTRRVELGEARKGSFLTSQGDRVVNVDPADFEPPVASAEPPPSDDE